MGHNYIDTDLYEVSFKYIDNIIIPLTPVRTK